MKNNKVVVVAGSSEERLASEAANYSPVLPTVQHEKRGQLAWLRKAEENGNM